MWPYFESVVCNSDRQCLHCPNSSPSPRLARALGILLEAPLLGDQTESARGWKRVSLVARPMVRSRGEGPAYRPPRPFRSGRPPASRRTSRRLERRIPGSSRTPCSPPLRWVLVLRPSSASPSASPRELRPGRLVPRPDSEEGSRGAGQGLQDPARGLAQRRRRPRWDRAALEQGSGRYAWGPGRPLTSECPFISGRATRALSAFVIALTIDRAVRRAFGGRRAGILSSSAGREPAPVSR